MTKKHSNILRPKNLSELRQTASQLTKDGYVFMPMYNPGEQKEASNWEQMVMNVTGMDSGSNKDGNYLAASSSEQPAPKNVGTKDLGWMSWGNDNKLPNNVASLTNMLPYTATGWKFNTDVTTGLGPKPKYRYTEMIPGIGISKKEIDYEAAGALIRQWIMELRATYIWLCENKKSDNDQSDLEDLKNHIGLSGAQQNSQSTEDRMRKDMLKDIEDDIERLESEYKDWDRTNKEVQDFMANTDLNLLLLKMASEFQMTGMCFPELQLSSDPVVETNHWKPRVTGLGLYSCWITRLERRDENGNINYVYLSNKWLEGKKAEDEDIAVLPALRPECPSKDLKERLVKIRTDNKLKKNNRPTRYVIPVAYPSPGKAYYTQPSWHSIFCGNIYEYASTIISDRAIRRKNSNIIGRIIYVNNDYLDKVFLQNNVKTNKDRQAIFDSIVSEINEFLCDPDNSGQSLYAYTFIGSDGKEHDSYKIVEIPASNKGTADANKTELEEVCNILFFAQGIHPDLIGAVPGHSGSSGGTYQREMLLIKQLLLSPTQQLLLKPFNTAAQINEWDPHLVWRVQQMALTTLDNSKTGMKETETD